MTTEEDQLEFIWDNDKDYRDYTKTKQMSNGGRLNKFHETYLAKRNRKWSEEPELEELALKLIAEEVAEFLYESGENQAALLKELADLV